MSERETLRLGGMALENGLFLHGPTHWAAAIRDERGEIRVASAAKPELRGLERVPLARGVVRMGELFTIFPALRRALPQARLPIAQRRVAFALGLSAAMGQALRRSDLPPLRRELLSALAGLVPSALIFRSPDLAAYHGAEHKTIGAYERGSSPADAPKEHERCGGHLVGPLLLATGAANAAAQALPAQHRKLGRLGGTLTAVGAAVEVFSWMDRHRQNPVSQALATPGHLLQRYASTAEPTPEQLEVAARALDELLRVEGMPAAQARAID